MCVAVVVECQEEDSSVAWCQFWGVSAGLSIEEIIEIFFVNILKVVIGGLYLDYSSWLVGNGSVEYLLITNDGVKVVQFVSGSLGDELCDMLCVRACKESWLGNLQLWGELEDNVFSTSGESGKVCGEGHWHWLLILSIGLAPIRLAISRNAELHTNCLRVGILVSLKRNSINFAARKAIEMWLTRFALSSWFYTAWDGHVSWSRGVIQIVIEYSDDLSGGVLPVADHGHNMIVFVISGLSIVESSDNDITLVNLWASPVDKLGWSLLRACRLELELVSSFFVVNTNQQFFSVGAVSHDLARDPVTVEYTMALEGDLSAVSVAIGTPSPHVARWNVQFNINIVSILLSAQERNCWDCGNNQDAE